VGKHIAKAAARRSIEASPAGSRSSAAPSGRRAEEPVRVLTQY